MEPVDPNLTYPNVEKTVLAHEPVKTVALSVDMLAGLLRTLKSCKATSITLGLPADPVGPIRLSAFTATGPIDGAMMPLRD